MENRNIASLNQKFEIKYIHSIYSLDRCQPCCLRNINYVTRVAPWQLSFSIVLDPLFLYCTLHLNRLTRWHVSFFLLRSQLNATRLFSFFLYLFLHNCETEPQCDRSCICIRKEASHFPWNSFSGWDSVHWFRLRLQA